MKNLGCSAAFLSLAATNALAHPGHEQLPVDGSSAWHYLLEPSHAVPALAVGCIVVSVFAVTARRLAARRRFEMR